MKRTIISIVIIAICFCLCACASTTELVESSDGDEFVTVPEVITEPATEPMSKEAALALFESTIRDMFAKTGNFSATAFSGDEARINFGLGLAMTIFTLITGNLIFFMLDKILARLAIITKLGRK